MTNKQKRFKVGVVLEREFTAPSEEAALYRMRHAVAYLKRGSMMDGYDFKLEEADVEEV